MRSNWKALVAAAASLALVPQLAAAEDEVQAQLRAMQDRMEQMEQRLQATDDELATANTKVAEQQTRLEAAGLEDERESRSMLSSFLTETDFSGWVTASYAVQTRASNSNNVAGQNNNISAFSPTTASFHPNNNSFQLDQVWFSMDKDVSAESRGGFHVDLLFGSAANVMGGVTGPGCSGLSSAGDCSNDFTVFTAYVSYLAPLGNGIRLDAGKLPTLLGAEVVQAPYNFNITRGLLWNLQPVNQTGLVLSSEVVDGVSVAAGVLNNAFSPNVNQDANLDKGITGQVAWSNDMFGASAQFVWGKNNFNGFNTFSSAGLTAATKTAITDIVLTADPTDNLSLWLNFDWIHNYGLAGVGTINAQGQTYPTHNDGYGLSVAGRYAFNEGDTGVALRGEYLWDSDGQFSNFSLPVGFNKSQRWSATATVDHALTENLTARGEFRYDGAKNNRVSDKIFQGSAGVPGRLWKDQFLFLADITYMF